MVTVRHFHGGPIWGKPEGLISDNTTYQKNALINALYRNGGAMVSFNRPEQLDKILRVVRKIWLDNGAFSIWKKALKTGSIVDWDEYWTKYYQFILKYYGVIDYFIIPDVIEGTEAENDKLINSVPSCFKDKAVPVWHSNESLEKLVNLCERFSMVAVGCCGEAGVIRSSKWKVRMNEVFVEIYVMRKMKVKLHGLRMLDGRAFCQFPFYSADSANVSINVPKTKARLPNVTCKLARTAIMRASIEKVQPPTVEVFVDNFYREKVANFFGLDEDYFK